MIDIYVEFKNKKERIYKNVHNFSLQNEFMVIETEDEENLYHRGEIKEFYVLERGRD